MQSADTTELDKPFFSPEEHAMLLIDGIHHMPVMDIPDYIEVQLAK